MSSIMYAWRAILWSWVVASTSSRQYMGHGDSVAYADKMVEEFDARFKIQGSGDITDRRKEADGKK